MSPIAFFSDPFLQMSLWAALLASIASGMIGSFVVIKRIAFIAGSISHSVIAGIGLSIWLNKNFGIYWIDPMSGAFLAALVSALLIGWIHLNYQQREDAVIAAIWSTGMALGVIFISLTPGSNAELMEILFGNILWITTKDLILLASLDLLLIGAVIIYYNRFLALCFDEPQAQLRGIATKRLYLLLLSLVGISIVILIQIIGAILVLALLIIPPTIANLFTSRLILMMGLGVLISSLISFLGLETSYFLNWPPGATIAFVAAIGYFISLIVKNKKFRLKRGARA